MTRASRLRQLLTGPDLVFFLEAHHALSARIVEEAGFPGIWASGLGIAAQLGLRDNNEATWTQVLDVLEFMADATAVPILADGDTGHGNFNTVRRLIRKLEDRGVAGVCLEDKTFPKTNSLLEGRPQPLADVDEFCGRLKAACDARRDDAFCLVARVEALVAGHGLDEALRRAEAYRRAGADAIFIHSRERSADEVLAFVAAWRNMAPVIVAPTTYYATPTERFRHHGVSAVIWANHLLRTSIAAMQQTAATIRGEEAVLTVEDRLAPLAEVFRLQNDDELLQAERRYLPARGRAFTAVVLAAARGAELDSLTATQPKAMVPVAGRPLLAHIVATCHSVGVTDVLVVRGYRKDAIALPDLRYVDNDEFDSGGELQSLDRAFAGLDPGRDLLVCYGDVLCHRYILSLLCEVPDDFAAAVDADWPASANRDRVADYVACTHPYSRTGSNAGVYLRSVRPDLPPADRQGEWMGLWKVAARAVPQARQALAEVLAADRQASVPALLNRLIADGRPVRVVYTTGHWLDVDTIQDVVDAGAFRAGAAPQDVDARG